MSPENRLRIHQLIGAAAFIIGGLLARSAAIENTEKLERMWKKNEEKILDPSTPPPVATEEQV